MNYHRAHRRWVITSVAALWVASTMIYFLGWLPQGGWMNTFWLALMVLPMLSAAALMGIAMRRRVIQDDEATSHMFWGILVWCGTLAGMVSLQMLMLNLPVVFVAGNTLMTAIIITLLHRNYQKQIESPEAVQIQHEMITPEDK